jgi:hypothetical protein
LGICPEAVAWLQVQADLGLAPRTIEAYGRGLADYLAVCRREGIEPLSAGRAESARYVRDLMERPSRRGPGVVPFDSGVGLANATLQQRLVAVRLFYDHLIEEGRRESNPVGRGRYTPGKAFGGHRERGLVPRLVKLPWIPSDDQWRSILEAARHSRASMFAGAVHLLAALLSGLATSAPPLFSHIVSGPGAMRKTQLVHQLMAKDMFLLLPGKLLEMVTIDAAKALGWDDQLGSLEVGKQADVIVVDLRQPHLAPDFMVVHRLVYEAVGNDVETVVVHGRLIMEDRQVLTVEVPAVLDRAHEESTRLIERAGLQRHLHDPGWGRLRLEFDEPVQLPS